jgi:hypothetical protein
MRTKSFLFYFLCQLLFYSTDRKMATRTSTRSTKAVKFVDTAHEEAEEEEFENTEPSRIKDEPKKVKNRGRPRRNPTNDDEEWDARNEESGDEEEDDDDDDHSEDEQDVTKKFKTNTTVNRTMDSVYDFG